MELEQPGWNKEMAQEDLGPGGTEDIVYEIDSIRTRGSTESRAVGEGTD